VHGSKPEITVITLASLTTMGSHLGVVYLVRDVSDLEKLLEEVSPRFTGKVPVKIHMGEPGNKYFLRPNEIEPVLKFIRENGGHPFLFDTVVLYRSPRSSVSGYMEVAKRHGFSEICDVVIDEEGVPVEVEGLRIEVCKTIATNSQMVVISHCKGHAMSGYGGAIKNLGMGGVTKETKRLLHEGAMPRRVEELCNYCGICAQVCPENAINVQEGQWVWDREKCFGCGKCVENCPEGALDYSLRNFLEALAISAKACLLGMRKVLYLNYLLRISKLCDCSSSPRNEIICGDIGILASEDIVSIEKASLDLIYEKGGEGLFERVHRVDPLRQIEYAEKIGLGSMDYELIEI